MYALNTIRMLEGCCEKDLFMLNQMSLLVVAAVRSELFSHSDLQFLVVTYMFSGSLILDSSYFLALFLWGLIWFQLNCMGCVVQQWKWSSWDLYIHQWQQMIQLYFCWKHSWPWQGMALPGQPLLWTTSFKTSCSTSFVASFLKWYFCFQFPPIEVWIMGWHAFLMATHCAVHLLSCCGQHPLDRGNTVGVKSCLEHAVCCLAKRYLQRLQAGISLPVQWGFASQLLSIPLLWQCFPYLKQVIVFLELTTWSQLLLWFSYFTWWNLELLHFSAKVTTGMQYCKPSPNSSTRGNLWLWGLVTPFPPIFSTKCTCFCCGN